MPKVIVDGTEIEVPADYSVLQACEAAGAEIPRFCYHERLSVAGNCRMCLVEWQGAPKPIASCAYGVRDLRPDRDGSPPKINTKTPVVKKAREGVMEFLLINHPLDCPICDQGGECDLQDQAMAYGRSGSRFEMNKRAVEEKHMGPLIKTVMTRCIQCTRCVRFAAEVAGVEEIGATGRGEDMEITTYLEQAMTSELSGNVIDLCPVGALTSKPYAFNARPWELKKTETIDVMDAVGSNIRMDVRGAEVLRVLPRLNEQVNEEWISDKTRYAVDGLKRQRLDQPFMKGSDGTVRPVSWSVSLQTLAKRLQGPAHRIGAIAGDLNCAEGLKAALDVLTSLGVVNLDCRQDGSVIGASGQRAEYLFNTTIAGLESADRVLLIGTNPRVEAPLVNARLRKSWLKGDLKSVGLVGPKEDLTFPYTFLGHGPQSLSDLVDQAGGFVDEMAAASRPALVLGMGALNRPDSKAILKIAAKIAERANLLRDGWNGWNVLHTAAGRVAGLDLNFLPGAGGLATDEMLVDGALDTLILLGADEVTVPKGPFVVYVGSHGDRGAQNADLILPAASYAEKSATYVNTEGRVQMAQRAVFPKGEAREDWAIWRAVSALFGDKPLAYNDLTALRRSLWHDYSVLAGFDYAPGADSTLDLSLIGEDGPVSELAFSSPINDFYLTNPIARASRVMAECSMARRTVGALQMAAE
jgi:NADH-quinone oxidoreductase subunit G